MSSKGKFKSKAASILKPKLTSMEDFLSDSDQDFKPKPVKKTVKKDEVERVHSNISKDIHDKLLDVVSERKKDKSLSKQQASKRGVIEDALLDFFKKHGI